MSVLSLRAIIVDLSAISKKVKKVGSVGGQ